LTDIRDGLEAADAFGAAIPLAKETQPMTPHADNDLPRRRRVEFALDMPHARQVLLMGDFNRWNAKAHPMRKDENGLWRKVVMVFPGRYEYRFRVDGEWQNDPANERRCPNCFGSENNVIDVKPGRPKP
jgi:1,4-alpha-glucan branching enzyme